MNSASASVFRPAARRVKPKLVRGDGVGVALLGGEGDGKRIVQVGVVGEGQRFLELGHRFGVHAAPVEVRAEAGVERDVVNVGLGNAGQQSLGL